jgi:hypothetical protein
MNTMTVFCNVQIIYRYRCIFCGKVAEHIQNLLCGDTVASPAGHEGFMVVDRFTPQAETWERWGDSWVCSAHKIEKTWIVDGKELEGIGHMASFPESKLDNEHSNRRIKYSVLPENPRDL